LENNRWPLLERREAFETVTHSNLVEFVKELRQNSYVQMHVQGNYYQTEVKEIFHKALEQLNGKKNSQKFTEKISKKKVFEN